MVDNVIIFGAGASADASVPMMNTFVDAMRGYALAAPSKRFGFSDEDGEVFTSAYAVMTKLSEYHARASFDDWNIEDLLSILSFKTLSGKEEDKNDFDIMKKAIGRTIELTCTIRHSGELNVAYYSGGNIYHRFWSRLFSNLKNPPTIITLNYDLVLERSLFQVLVQDKKRINEFDFDGITLDYHYKFMKKFHYKLEPSEFLSGIKTSVGTILKPCEAHELTKPLTIEILKLHGSLNFPDCEMEQTNLKAPTNPVDTPFIVPPISTKTISHKLRV